MVPKKQKTNQVIYLVDDETGLCAEMPAPTGPMSELVLETMKSVGFRVCSRAEFETAYAALPPDKWEE